MKYSHTLILASAVCVFPLSMAFAQGGPPSFPAGPPPEDPVTAPTPQVETVEENSEAPVQEPEAKDPAVAEKPAFVPPTRTPRSSIPAITPVKQDGDRLQSFEFASADIDTVMSMYSEWTGKIYLKSDQVAASISLKVDRLTIPECIDALEAILAMNNIIIVPYGEKFVKVVQANSADLTGNGGIVNYSEDAEYQGRDRLVSQMIPLKNVQIKEVQTAIQHLMHSYGKIQTLEGSNSLLITDTESNIIRIRELVDFLDQASARIEPRFYEIIHAEASEIASKLNEIIVAAQVDQQTTSSSRTATTSNRTVIRAARNQTPTATTPSQATISSTQAGSQTIIQGTVKVMADERTNLIIIFSQKENFDFFENMIKMLDVEVEPAITLKSSTLNMPMQKNSPAR